MNQQKKDPKIKAPTVITAHNNADFDCLSSMVAARKLYPQAVLIFPGSQEQSLRNFFIQSATYLYNFYSFKDIDPDSVETLVVCDTRQKSRLSHISPLLEKKGLTIHSFDHHPDSDDDLSTDYQLIRPWGSTIAILVPLLKEKDIQINEDEATMMGLGLYEDTGCFTFSSTTSHDFEAALWLKEQNMDVNFISDFLNRELNAEQVSILNTLLNSASRHTINDIDIYLTSISIDRYIRDFAVLVHKMMEIENIKVLFALARMQDRIHVIARSQYKNVDAGRICASLGGGGHAYAASATIKDKTLAQVQDELFGLLYSHINIQINVHSLMSSPPVLISQEATINQAATNMNRFSLKAIPVVKDHTKQCVGILEYQLATKAQAHGLGEFEVREYMLRNFSQASPEDSLYNVIETVIAQGQRLVPVVEEDEIIGVITRTDLINCLVEEPARIPESLFPERRQEKNIQSLMHNRLPDHVYSLLQKAGEIAQEKGFKVYAVGGFVRDILLHRPNLDIDLVVERDGITYAKHLINSLGGRIRAHKKFKTAVVILPNGQRIDVATARLEYYEHPAALPTVELSSIKMDLFRRDFSINALAIELNPKKFGRLVDFFGGQHDIKDKVIRVLHSLSFIEDPTRILRAIRFEQRFTFRIGKQTERLIKNALQLNMIHKLSGSRLFHELKLIFEEERPLTCLKRMGNFDILQSIHPVLKLGFDKINLLEKIEKVIDWYELLYIEYSPEVWKIYLLGLCSDCNNEQVNILTTRFNLSDKLKKAFLQLRTDIHKTQEQLYLWQRHDNKLSGLYFILNPIPIEGNLYLMASNKNEYIRKHISLFLSKLRYQNLEISGKDLKAMGLPPGPVYTEILKEILAARIDGQAKDRESQLELASQLVHQEMKNDVFLQAKDPSGYQP